MTFDRTKNAGLALLILLLAFLALLGHWESRLSREATQAIEHEHNPALQLAQRQRALLHATEIAFEIYRRRDPVLPGDVTELFDELHVRARQLADAAPADADAATLVRHVETARAAWRQILGTWRAEADLTSDTLIEMRHLVDDELLGARVRLGALGAGMATGAPSAPARQASTLINLLGTELDAFMNQEPIDLQDVLEPVNALIDSLVAAPTPAPGAGADARPDESAVPTPPPIAASRADALDAARRFRGLLHMFDDAQTDWSDGRYHGTLDMAASALKAAEAAVLRLGRRSLDDVSASSAALDARLERAARLRDALSLAGVLFALCVSVVLGRALGRHVDAVVEGTGALAAGELGHRLAEPRGDRLGEIAGAFNRLAEQLADKEREQTRYVAALDRAVSEAQAANVAKSEFLASMSHEIRTPINGVLGTADLLLRETLSRSQRHLAETIQRSGGSLLGIINDILDFSKIEAGHMAIEVAPLDLTLLIEDVCEMAAPAAHGKGLELNSVVRTEIPVAVLGDAVRIRQVLTNLVGNAIKFTPSGEVVVELEHRVTDDGGHRYRIDVRDTGIGIAPEAQGRIYDAFSQANRSTARRYGGTGLGLSITLELVQLMGGETGLDSAPGKGSRFWFELPLERDPVASGAGYDDVGCARALLVCHAENAARALDTRLGALGVRGSTVPGGGAALEALRRADGDRAPRFDVVFVDDRLDDMEPGEFARRMDAELPVAVRPPRVALCRVDEDAASARARHAAGFAALLPKPVRQSALYNCLLELHAPHVGALVDAADERPLARLDGHVLLVEDHAVNQDIVTRMLVWLGCEVTLAEEGRAALRELERRRFDLVLMDCDMPVMDGFEATRRLRARERPDGVRQPVVALTANALGGDRERCLGAGMDDYLTKPIVLETLHRALVAWLPERGQSAARPTASGADAEGGATALLDAAVIDGLKAMERPGDGFVDGLITTFSTNWPTDRDALLEAHRQGDAERCRKAAHRLKSASANLGAAELAALCARIEIAAAGGDLELIPTILTTLDDVFDNTLDALRGVRQEAA